MLENPLRANLTVWGFFVLVFAAVVLFFVGYGEALSLEAEARTTLARGAQMRANDRLDKARSEYENFLRIDPSDLRVLSELTYLYSEIDDEDTALAAAQAGVEAVAGSERIHALLIRGDIEMARLEFDDAAATYHEVVEAIPKSGHAHIRLAEIARVNSDFLGMVDHYSRAKDFSLGAATWAFRRVYDENRDRILPLQRAVRKEPSGGGFYELGVRYADLADWPNAVKHYELAAQIDYRQVDAVFWLGVNAESEGDFEEAEAFYSEALTRNPNHDDAQAGLKRCADAIHRER